MIIKRNTSIAALTVLLLAICTNCTPNIIINNNLPHVGLFKSSDKQLDGLFWANWGSRPYEYHWASQVVSVAGKKVIDLGIGLPSQHSWPQFVLKQLKPELYLGIDIDERIAKEQVSSEHYLIRHMSMTNITYPNEYFDVAYCISTFEHLPYVDFMKAIDEAYRVLKQNGLLIITLDEQWDKTAPQVYENSWNTLELDLIKKGRYQRKTQAFGLPSFLKLIEHRFTCIDNCTIDTENGTVRTAGKTEYQKINCDENVLHHTLYNSCVSFAVLRKVNA